MKEKVTLSNGSLQLIIAVTGYEFSKMSDPNDANWLLVEVDLIVGEKRFCNTWPALETGDLDRISHWFDDLGHARLPSVIRLGFLEPNLEFQVFRATDEFVRIGVHLSHESKPPFRTLPLIPDPEEQSAICIFELTYAELLNISVTFQQISEQFPKREFISSTDTVSQHFLKMQSSRFS